MKTIIRTHGPFEYRVDVDVRDLPSGERTGIVRKDVREIACQGKDLTTVQDTGKLLYWAGQEIELEDGE